MDCVGPASRSRSLPLKEYVVRLRRYMKVMLRTGSTPCAVSTAEMAGERRSRKCGRKRGAFWSSKASKNLGKEGRRKWDDKNGNGLPSQGLP